MADIGRPAVFTIGAHRSFADALAAGLIARHGKEPLGLARGRILLPNNRAVRSIRQRESRWPLRSNRYPG